MAGANGRGASPPFRQNFSRASDLLFARLSDLCAI